MVAEVSRYNRDCTAAKLKILTIWASVEKACQTPVSSLPSNLPDLSGLLHVNFSACFRLRASKHVRNTLRPFNPLISTSIEHLSSTMMEFRKKHHHPCQTAKHPFSLSLLPLYKLPPWARLVPPSLVPAHFSFGAGSVRATDGLWPICQGFALNRGFPCGPQSGWEHP